MATDGNQTRLETSLAARRTSPPATAKKPGRGVKHGSNNQEVQRYSDHLWLSKQRSSPSLLFYRKLSDDSSEGTVSNEEYDCLDCGAKGLGAAQKAPTELSAASSEEGQARDTGRGRCTTSPGSCSHYSSASSPTSSTSPADSPHLTSSPARQNPRHLRRSSLPMSMLPFHKVGIKFQGRFGGHFVKGTLQIRIHKCVCVCVHFFCQRAAGWCSGSQQDAHSLDSNSA